MIAAASAMLALGGVGLGGGYSHRRRTPEPSIDEVEERWVHDQMMILRERRKKACKVVAELAKATGPWAHRFGYGPPPQTREIARRLRQQARQEAKRRG